MRLSAKTKKNVIDTASAVYKNLVSLDFMKTRVFHTREGNSTLFELCERAIAQNQLEQVIELNGCAYELKLVIDEQGVYRISFNRAVRFTPLDSPSLLSFTEYSDEDVLDLLTEQHFFVEAKENKWYVGNQFNAEFAFGGKGKIDIYRTHLVTLLNIINKLDSESEISNLLVAMATGSGKTYTSALLMFITLNSENHGIFSVPDNLVEQLVSDLKRFLPDNFVDRIISLKGKEDKEIRAILSQLPKEKEPRIIISSSEQLLDKYYPILANHDTENIFLSFDEQHLLMRSELRRVRLLELAKNKLTTLLTATPDELTYEMSGKKPVGMMSSGQKAKAGQGQFPSIMEQKAENISDRCQFTTYRFWTLPFWGTVLQKISLLFSNAIQDEPSSASMSVLENLPFYAQRESKEARLRWRFQAPMSRKMLFIVDNNEELINLVHGLEQGNEIKREIYHNGNVVKREDIGEFFGLPDVDYDVLLAARTKKEEDYLASLETEEERVIGRRLIAKSVKQQLQDNIFHALMEFVLSDLTGLDEIAHNHLRKTDPEAFRRLIADKLVKRNEQYFRNKLQGLLIDEESVNELSPLLAYLSDYLSKTPRNPHPDNSIFAQFVDNWELNDDIIATVKASSLYFCNQFEHYANANVSVAVMQHHTNAEMPIEDSRPFSGLNRDDYPLYDGNVLSKQAKKRKHSALETLNDQTCETRFTPNYRNRTEVECDRLFRLGFIGAYISNKKTQGFSDPYLHTVINIAESRTCATNNPNTLVQGIGRNRGLDDSKKPAYIYASGREGKGVFNLQHLLKEDYYPDLFKAQKQYNKEFIAVLGEKVGQEIIEWFNTHFDKDETIDSKKLKKQVLKIVARALRELNNNNQHDIKLSRAQLSTVIGIAMTGLNNEINRLKKPYDLSFFIRALGSVLNFISELYYWPKRRAAQQDLQTEAKNTANDKSTADSVYAKIINKTSFKQIISKLSVAKEFKDWITKKADGVQVIIQKDTEAYLAPDLKTAFDKHKESFLKPLFTKCVMPGKRELVLDALNNIPNFISFFETNQTLLKTITDSMAAANVDDAQLKKTILSLLHKVPGLETLVLADVVNYPKQIKTILDGFDNPLALIQYDTKLQQRLIQDGSAYLRGDFLKSAAPLFLQDDFTVFQRQVMTEGRCENFLKKTFNDLCEGKTFELDALREELKNDFAATTADMRLNEFQQQMQSLYSDVIFQDIANTVYQKLVPCMINMYPLDDRARLYQQISQESVKNLLVEKGVALAQISELSPEQIAEVLFSELLGKDALPQMIDLKQEIGEAQQGLLKQFDTLKDNAKMTAVRGGFRKLFSPSQWGGVYQNPLYLADKSVQAILRGSYFSRLVSLMLPFDQWERLNKRLQDNHDPLSMNMAHKLLDMQQANEDLSEFDVEALLQLINECSGENYNLALQQATEAQQEIETCLEEQVNVLHKLSADKKQQLIALLRQNFYPLLALHINNEEGRKAFIAHLPDDNALFAFFIQHQTELGDLQGEEAMAKQVALGFLQELVPSLALSINEIELPLAQSEKALEQIQQDGKKALIKSYLGSEAFFSLISHVMNATDYHLLRTYLRQEDKLEALANQLQTMLDDREQGVNDDDFVSSVLKLLHKEESLANIDLLSNRFDEFKDFLNGLELNDDNFVSVLNRDKLAQLLTEQLAPIIFNKKFVSILDELMGFLSESDLVVMMNALGKPGAKEKAALLFTFMQTLKTQNITDLTSLFLSLPKDKQLIDDLPFKITIDLVANVLEEILECQCYFNQQDQKGNLNWGDRNNSSLAKDISPGLQQSRVDNEWGFWNSFSRKIFFIQGIRNGLPDSAAVQGEANQERIKRLQAINDNLLRPLWWSTNISKTSLAFVRFFQKVGEGFQQFGASIAALFTGRSSTPLSSYTETSVEEVFQFAQVMNDLAPMTEKEVLAPDCPQDKVCNLEANIARRHAGPGFFRKEQEAVREGLFSSVRSAPGFGA